jgi:putative ABC transport system permease protein
MRIPFKYTFRSLFTRRLTTAITVVGITLVVFVFAAVLMMANGIRRTLVSTGDERNVLVARKGSNGEISSIIPSETANIILALPQVARDVDGRAIASGDAVVIINLDRFGGGQSNLAVRGVSSKAFELRPQVKLREGRMLTWGAREIIVGAAVAKRFRGAQIGSEIKFGGDQWRIVGLFETDGSGFDSEMWVDAQQLQDAFRRGGSYSTVTFRLSEGQTIESVRRTFSEDNRLQQFEPKTERSFFEEESEMMATFIRILGIFVTVIFSFGAVIGATITMYAAVANRTVELGTMRALGFRRRSVLISFMAESLLIALAGGLLGVVLASFLQFFSVSTLNFGSFSELEFSFALSPSIIIASLVFSLSMGLVGGFAPAVRASRLNIVNALRER